jgi:hypothetical protein
LFVLAGLFCLLPGEGFFASPRRQKSSSVREAEAAEGAKPAAVTASADQSKLVSKRIIAGQDAYVRGGSVKTTPYGSTDRNNIAVRDWAEAPEEAAPGAYMAGYLLFDIPPESEFNDPGSITSIKIRLFKHRADKSAADYHAIFLSNLSASGESGKIESFDEASVTFEKMRTKDPQAQDSVAFDFSRLLIEGSEVLVPIAPGWVEFDVTAAVKPLIMANKTGKSAPALFAVANARPLHIGDIDQARHKQVVYYYSKEFNGGQYAPEMVISNAGISAFHAAPALTLTVKNRGGADKTLTVDGNKSEALIRFDRSDISTVEGGSLKSAKLVLTAEKIPLLNRVPLTLSAVKDFDETASWNSRPAVESVIAVFDSTADKGKKIELDISALVRQKFAAGENVALKISSTETMDTPAVFSVTAPPPELLYEAEYGVEMKGVKIQGPEHLVISHGENRETPCQGYIIDQFGALVKISNSEFSYEISPGYPGIDISPSGVITVSSSAVPGTVTVKGILKSDPGKTGSFTARLEYEPGARAEPAAGNVPRASPAAAVRSAPRRSALNAAGIAGLLRGRQHPYLLYDRGDLENLRQKITRTPYSAVYANLRQYADRFTAQQLAEYRANNWIWMDTDMFYGFSPFEFTVPAGAVNMKIAAVAKGQGVVYFDDVTVRITRGAELNVPNASFESGSGNRPANWEFGTDSGRADFEWASKVTGKSIVNRGNRSVKLINTTPGTVSYVQSGAIGVKAGTSYTATAAMAMEGKLTGPMGPRPEYSRPDFDARVYMRVVFFDGQGNRIGTKDYLPDRNTEINAMTPNRTWINYSTKPLRRIFSNSSESAAFEYAITGNAEYARRAMFMLIYQLEDIEWGMKYIRASYPAGNGGTGYYNNKMHDSYEAVHVGRALGLLSLVYDMIAGSGVSSEVMDFTDDYGVPYRVSAEEWIRKNFKSIARRLLTDNNYYNLDSQMNRQSNYNADRSTGLAMFSLAFPDLANEDDMVRNGLKTFDYANEELEYIMSASVHNDGMWGETMRYHFAVLNYWMLYGSAINKIYPGQSILDDPKFKKMVQFIVDFQGPKLLGTANPNLAGYIPIGDAAWRDPEDLYVAGWMASVYAQRDPALSRALMHTWERFGSVVNAYHRTAALAHFDVNLPKEKPDLQSRFFPDTGYIVFRKNFDQKGREFMLVMNGNSILPSTMHNHSDRGSFSLIANSTPVSLDSGMGGYFSGDAGWWRKTEAHNVVQFYDESTGTYIDNSPQSVPGFVYAEIKDFFASLTLDSARVAVSTSLARTYERSIAFVKDKFDVFLVFDYVESNAKSRLNLFTVSRSFERDGSVITAQGLNHTGIDIRLLNIPNPKVDWRWTPVDGSSASYGLPLINGQQQQQNIMVEQEPGKSYLTLIYPQGEFDTPLDTVQIPTGSPVARAYKITKARDYFVALVNEYDEARTVRLPGIKDSLRNLRTGTVIPPNGEITVMPGDLVILLH